MDKIMAFTSKALLMFLILLRFLPTLSGLRAIGQIVVFIFLVTLTLLLPTSSIPQEQIAISAWISRAAMGTTSLPTTLQHAAQLMPTMESTLETIPTILLPITSSLPEAPVSALVSTSHKAHATL